MHEFHKAAETIYTRAKEAWGNGEMTYDQFATLNLKIANLGFVMRNRRRTWSDAECMEKLAELGNF